MLSRQLTTDVLGEITVLIPARNEAEVIQQTLRSVSALGAGLRIILIDDNSDDATVEKARKMQLLIFALFRAHRFRSAGAANFGRLSKAAALPRLHIRYFSTPTLSWIAVSSWLLERKCINKTFPSSLSWPCLRCHLVGKNC